MLTSSFFYVWCWRCLFQLGARSQLRPDSSHVSFSLVPHPWAGWSATRLLRCGTDSKARILDSDILHGGAFPLEGSQRSWWRGSYTRLRICYVSYLVEWCMDARLVVNVSAHNFWSSRSLVIFASRRLLMLVFGLQLLSILSLTLTELVANLISCSLWCLISDLRFTGYECSPVSRAPALKLSLGSSVPSSVSSNCVWGGWHHRCRTCSNGSGFPESTACKCMTISSE